MIPLRYNLRSLAVRRATTVATTAGIALVVFVLTSTLMLKAGIKKALRSTGRPDNVVLLSSGADVELGGLVDESWAPIVLGAPGVKHDGDGPLGVAEDASS